MIKNSIGLALASLLTISACAPVETSSATAAATPEIVNRILTQQVSEFDRFCKPLAQGTSIGQVRTLLNNAGYSAVASGRSIRGSFGNFNNLTTYARTDADTQISLGQGVISGQAWTDASGGRFCTVVSNVSLKEYGTEVVRANHERLKGIQEANATNFGQATGQSLSTNPTLFGTDAAFGDRRVGSGKNAVLFTTQENPAALILIDSY